MLQVDDKIRLNELKKYQISFDTPEICFNELAEIARSSLDTPLSGISIVDQNNVWLKARLGVEAHCLDREGAFCSHAIESEQDIYCIEDTKEHEFYKTHPLLINLGVRFYAAAILRNEMGYPIGTIWVMDLKPRKLSASDKTILLSLSSQAMRLLDYSYTDTSTGLPNRKTFIDSLQSIIGAHRDPSIAPSLLKEYSAPQGVVGVFVIDNLDIISSIFSETGVKKTLELITERLKNNFPERTILAHIEENVFAFARVNTTELEQFFYQDISEKLSAPISIEHNQTKIQTSMGLVRFPDNGNNASSLTFQALTAARRAKNNRNANLPDQIGSVSDARYIKALHKVLQQGINQQELSPYYQPQINTQTNQLSGLEALARWHSESLGFIPPTVFVQLAEETGLIAQLDYLMLEKVCADIQHWQKQQLPCVPVSVNLSRESIISSDTVSRVKALLAKYDVAHHYIKVEITESTMISDYDPVLANIAGLRNLGLPISIDDFGTGFSNLSTLRLLEFDQLKVDRQFIHNISQGDSIPGLFDFIKNVGSLFSANLMCEGMENLEDVEYLISVGCFNHQGWFFSKALKAQQIEQLITELQTAKNNALYPEDHIELARFLEKYQRS
jgi:EAL domain-containing protein (putative c-di-GMP-specific phosphodiesterase class I)/GGDEF domain-containing protein